MKPEIGSKWQHHNGNQYEVVMVANEASQRPEYPVTIIYRGENGNVWSKSADDFISKMKEVK